MLLKLWNSIVVTCTVLVVWPSAGQPHAIAIARADASALVKVPSHSAILGNQLFFLLLLLGRVFHWSAKHAEVAMHERPDIVTESFQCVSPRI